MKQFVIDGLLNSIKRRDEIISRLRAEIGRYTEQLDRANKAMERWTPAMGRNGRMDVGGIDPRCGPLRRCGIWPNR